MPLYQILVNLINIRFWDEISSNLYEWENVEKNKHSNCNNNVAMSGKFQSIGKTSHFGTKFVQKNMTEKNFEKQTLI